MENVLQTLISQYSASPTLRALVVNVDEYLDPRADLDTFYDFVWNVDTAEGFGLDTWGKIVNVGRLLNVPCETPNPGMFPFTGGTYALTDEQYRVVIFTKALTNITNGSAASINQVLQNLFAGRGRTYVLDLGNMAMQYTFEFYLEPFEYVMLSNGGVAPRPAGVLVSINQGDVDDTFGFDEAEQFQPFDEGVFYNSDPFPIPGQEAMLYGDGYAMQYDACSLMTYD